MLSVWVPKKSCRIVRSAGFGRIEMVESGKHSAKSVEVRRNLGRVYRFPDEVNMIRSQRLGFSKFCRARKFIGEKNFHGFRAPRLKPANERRPRPSRA